LRLTELSLFTPREDAKSDPVNTEQRRSRRAPDGQKADLAQPRKDSGSAPKKLRQKNSSLSVRWILDSISGALGPDPESATPATRRNSPVD
jgi:hypothetical protein